MTADDEVKAASERFYAALNRMLNGDAGGMTGIWSEGPTVTTMHPIGGRETGWEQVGKSWEQVAALASDGRVEIADQFIRVMGDAAYELGVERGQFSLGGETLSIEWRVTNIYHRESRRWSIVHHHTDLSPTMIDALGRLQK